MQRDVRRLHDVHVGLEMSSEVLCVPGTFAG